MKFFFPMKVLKASVIVIEKIQEFKKVLPQDYKVLAGSQIIDEYLPDVCRMDFEFSQINKTKKKDRKKERLLTLLQKKRFRQ